MNNYKWIYLLILCIFVFSACEKKDLPDQDFIDFALKIEKQIMKYEDKNFIESIFDYKEFEKRVLTEVEISKKEKERASKFIRENTNPAMFILEAVANGADFRFVNFYRKDNEPHLLLRTYFNGWMSLMDWTLSVKKGEIVICDAFVIMSGFNWSDECRQKLYNYLGTLTENVLNMNNLIEINYLITNENYTAADSMMYWVMPQMQNNLYARTMELNLCSQSKPYEKVQMLAKEFVKTFPNKKQICDFYLMQSSIQHGLPDETLKHIHSLIDLIGDDPVYYIYQSRAFKEANANDFALQMLDSAIRYIPYILDSYLNKLDIYYSDNNYQSCVDMLYVIDSVFESGGEEDAVFFQKNYPLLEEYAPFKEWLKSKSSASLTKK